MEKTLLYYSIDQDELREMVKSTLQGLVNNELATRNCSVFVATMLGQAILASSLAPEHGLFAMGSCGKFLRPL
jgi:hypothetical protein